MKDFYLKLYDKNKNIKFSENRAIIEKSNFFASINSSFSDMKIKIQTRIDDDNYKIGDFIKIYHKNRLYFQGYIFYIDRVVNYNAEFLEISLISPGNFISNGEFTENGRRNNFKNIFLDLIEKCNTFFGFEILKNGIDLEILNSGKFIEKEIVLESGKQWNFLELLKEIFKQIEEKFFIDFDGKIIISGKKYFLTIGRNIDKIVIGQTSNDIIKNTTLANKTKIKINNNFDYWQLKPGDLIKILNLKYKIKEIVISKINFSDFDASVDLESFNSFTDLIKKIG